MLPTTRCRQIRLSWFNYHVSHCDVIFLLLLQEPTVNVTKCMDSRNDAGRMTMRCEQDITIQAIQIEEVNLWRANSGNNREKIDLNDRSRYNCKQRLQRMLREKISRACNGRRICRYAPKYRNWHNCSEKKDLPNRPIFLEIAFECVSCEYLFSPANKIIVHI